MSPPLRARTIFLWVTLLGSFKRSKCETWGSAFPQDSRGNRYPDITPASILRSGSGRFICGWSGRSCALVPWCPSDLDWLWSVTSLNRAPACGSGVSGFPFAVLPSPRWIRARDFEQTNGYKRWLGSTCSPAGPAWRAAGSVDNTQFRKSAKFAERKS